jgi:hypothetical protein
VPPVSWGGIQVPGNNAQNALNDLRVALAGGQTANALQLIDTAGNELQKFIVGLRESCSGGSHGQDPVNYGGYVATVITVKAKLQVLRELLE